MSNPVLIGAGFFRWSFLLSDVSWGNEPVFILSQMKCGHGPSEMHRLFFNIGFCGSDLFHQGRILLCDRP